MIRKNITKLTTILGMGSIDGVIPLAAISGLLTIENIPVIAFVLIAGPGAVITAAMLEGTLRDRILSALISGTIATILVVLAAGIGPIFLQFVNTKVVRIIGGIAVGTIALIIVGAPIPENLPLVVVIAGVILGIILR
jgi:hypothetical protein